MIYKVNRLLRLYKLKIIVAVPVIVMLILPYLSKGQSIISDSGVVYKRGIYRSFLEFKNNQPSVELIDFEIEEHKKTIRPLFDKKESQNYYTFKFNENKIHQSKVVYWGISDGKNVYVLDYNTVGQDLKHLKYYKLEFLGRYCYYQAIISHTSKEYYGGTTNIGTGYPGNYTTIPAMGERTKHEIELIFFDMNSGARTRASERSLEKMLLDDDAILEEFKNDSLRESNFKEYIKKYSLKHADAILR